MWYNEKKLFEFFMKRSVLFFFGVGLFFASGFFSCAQAATITAAQTGNWSSTSTWTGGVVPGASDDVQIVVDASVTITIDQDVTVNSIKLGAGTTYAKRDTLILGTGRTLTVTGTFQWDKVGIFQQNAGSSVTAASYMFGTSGSGYSMVGWNIYGTAENRASVHGTGSIVAADPSTPPVQQVDWQYATFDIGGTIVVSLKNAWDANAYSSLNINHCAFLGTGYLDIGAYYRPNSASGSGPITITNNDFRNITSTVSGVNAQVYVRNGTLVTAPFYGTRTFSGNTFSQVGNTGLVYLQTIGNGFEVKSNIFKNVALSLNYSSGLANAYRNAKVYDNLFYAGFDAGVVNGLFLDYGGGIDLYDNLFMGQSGFVE